MPLIDFLLPADDHKNVVPALLRSVPDSWDCLTGRLRATSDVDARLLDPAGVAYTILHWKATWHSAEGRGDLDPYRAFNNDMLPRSVEFVLAGKKDAVYDLARCKKVAMHYVQLGYTGGLTLVPVVSRIGASRVGVRFYLEDWDEPVQRNSRETLIKHNPPLLRLFYDHNDGGNIEMLVPVLAAARRLKLLPIGQ